MQTRQPLGTSLLAAVHFSEHRVLVRFRPDQRKAAKFSLILGCFQLGYVIPLTHPVFDEIDKLTWEPGK